MSFDKRHLSNKYYVSDINYIVTHSLTLSLSLSPSLPPSLPPSLSLSLSPSLPLSPSPSLPLSLPPSLHPSLPPSLSPSLSPSLPFHPSLPLSLPLSGIFDWSDRGLTHISNLQKVHSISLTTHIFHSSYNLIIIIRMVLMVTWLHGVHGYMVTWSHGHMVTCYMVSISYYYESI